MYTFDSLVSLGKELQEWPAEVVKNEPMFFNASVPFAYEHGGPITRDFLSNFGFTGIDADGIVFDSRVHMLMRGWWPCIPGWHHDDVPRTGPDGQPDYDFPEYRSKHAFAIVGDDVSRTEFALGSARFARPRKGEIFYKVWHPMVESKIETKQLRRWDAPMHQVVYFDDRTWHQGTVATGAGWRWFGRASWNTGRTPTDEIRRQVQVYMEHPMEGW